MTRDAVISEDGRFRYRLTRAWPGFEDGRHVTFVMLNPSTADALEDDPTIRRCIGFARSWLFSSLVVVNLFAFRATSPADLRAAWKRGEDVEGPANAHHIEASCVNAGAVVLAWGAFNPGAKLFLKFRTVVRRAVLSISKGTPLLPETLGLTASGSPPHPLYLKADTKRTPMTAELKRVIVEEAARGAA